MVPQNWSSVSKLVTIAILVIQIKILCQYTFNMPWTFQNFPTSILYMYLSVKMET